MYSILASHVPTPNLCIPLSIATIVFSATHISHHRTPILQYRTLGFPRHLEPYILRIHICITNAYARHLLLFYM